MGSHLDSQIEILIVEDSITQVAQLEYILREKGYHVSVARNGMEAFSLISKHKPTIVISDIIMPEIDGFELCRLIKSDDNLKEIPVIFLTALSDPKDVIKGLDCGADNFITKPFNENYLLARIQYILNSLESRKQGRMENGLSILFEDEKFVIRSERHQILDFLISAYEIAIQQNQELIRIRDELRELNEQLGEKIKEKTFSLMEEINERKQTEKALRSSEARLRTLIEKNADSIMVVDRKGIVHFANRSTEVLFGQRKEELIGKQFGFPLLTGETAEIDINRKDGEKAIAEMSVVNTEWERESAYLLTLRDITERKLSEEALRQSGRELSIRNLIANIFLTTPDNEIYGKVLQIILEAMKSKYGIFGYIDEHDNLIIPSMTKDLWDQCQVSDKTLVYPRETWGGIWGRALKEKRSLYANKGLCVPEGHLPITKGLVVPIMYHREPIGLLEVANKASGYDERDQTFLETIANYIAPILNARLQRDRHENARKKAEKALSNSEEKYRIIFKNTGTAMTINEEDTTITLANTEAGKLCGYSKEELVGKSWTEFVLKDDLEKLKMISQLQRTDPKALPMNYEFRLVDRHGNVKNIFATFTLIPGTKKRAASFLNITEQIQLEEQLRHSQKMKTFGQLAAGVAHEVRNPLNAIMSITDALFLGIGENPEYLPYLEHVRVQVNRLSQLMKDLLELGKPIQAYSFNRESLIGICMSVLNIWNGTDQSKRHNLRFVSHPGSENIYIHTDSAKLQQIFLNLIENAVQNSPDGSEIFFQIFAPSDGLARIHIVDTGTGIQPEHLEHIFEPFFTTRKGGTGLGLGIVKQFLEIIGGKVAIWNNESSPGCTAEVSLPIDENKKS